MKKLLLMVFATFVTSATQATGFVERFALAEDRGAVLQELLPGSDDAFYYTALHELNQSDFTAFNVTMEAWKRERQSQGWPDTRSRELLNREALLRYPAAPQESLKYITELLGLRFEDSRKDGSRVVNLPSVFDNRQVARAGLLARSLKERPADLSLIEPAGYHLLQDARIGEAQRLDLLKRLSRPDFKGLVDLIAADLLRDGAQFGSLEIHSKLTLAQLDELVGKRNELWRSERFVETYLARLLPPDEVDLERELDQRDAYYARLWGALQNLSQDFNSRRANLLCNWIRNDLKRGEFNKGRLLEYVKYPRAAPYTPRLEGAQRAHALNFNQHYNSRWLPPIGNEEPLVRKCLLRVFTEAPDYKEFAPYFKEEYLRAVFAEAKITAGAGTPEQWISWLSRSQYDAIKRRVDIEFADENPVVVGRDQPVALTAYVKNVKSLIVKVYEINTENWFRESGVPVDLSMDLNGLTATHEKVFQYSDADAIRVRREYQFPELQGRGVYIIELIGNGRSSRALVQKGHLKVVPSITAGGHAFAVYDEDGQPVKDCVVWFNGASFAAAQDGHIYIPFASVKDDPIMPLAPRAVPMAAAYGPNEKYLVVSAGNFSSLVAFNHLSESYTLEGGFYVDREALIAGELCEVVVRPRLALNGQSVALSLLKKINLTLASVDLDGVESRSKMLVPALTEEADFVHQFRVPARCVRISFTLDGRVENMALNKEQELTAFASFDFNASERGADVRHLFLVHHSKGYTIEVRGKNGEAAADVPVHLAFKHRLFTREVNASLKSDKVGLLQLGELKEIEWMRGTWDGVDSQRQRTWNLEQMGGTYPQELHGTVNETMKLAVPQSLSVAEDLSLLELRGGAYVREWRAALVCEDGMVEIKGLPAGDYELTLISLGHKIPVRVTEARVAGSDLISPRRVLERKKLKPLTIAAISSDAAELRIQLGNVLKYARVHLVATRYAPEFSLADHLSVAGGNALLAQGWRYPGCYYKSGRDIGDEYRYILERQHAQKFPGNMLQRPGLLIAPWSTQTSEADKESLALGQSFDSAADAKGAAAQLRAPGGSSRRSREVPTDAIGSCNFLKDSAVTLYNLKPNAEGVVTVPLAALKAKQFLRIAAVDPESLVVREFALAESAVTTRDLRLAESLPAGVGYSEKQRATVLAAGAMLEIKDVGSARFEIYDTVGKLFNLYGAISNDPELKKFDFVANWPALEPKLKRELYSKYACHELNLFLYFKDQPFFKSVIKPLVAAKKNKRFVDHWLIGADLGQYQSGYGYSRLNAAERALLAQRVAGRKAAIAREIREQVEMLPVDQERINRLFDTALQGQALDSGQGVDGRAEKLMDAPADEAKTMLAGAVQIEAVASVRSPVIMRKSALQRTLGAVKPMAAAPVAALEVMKSEEQTAERGASLGDHFAAGLEARGTARQLYQRLESTKEWAENNYYELPIERQGPELISANVFWQEYAAHQGERGFVSGHATETADSLAEMMLALAVMDLPFESAKHIEGRESGGYKLQAASPLVVYHREVLESAQAAERQALVAQRFFRPDDRYRYEGNERFDKTVTDEFLKRVVYGAQVVLTNPTGGRLKLRVLLQIPQGALPVLGGFYTKGFYVTLEPYATHMQEFFFYFPESGKYPHYPVTLSSDEQVIGEAAALTFNVVDVLSSADKESWGWISQNGSNAEVAEYLKHHNLYRIDLAEIAWRMKDKPYFQEVLKLLSERLVYDEALWSYSLQHNVPERIAEYLARGAFATQCGLSIDSTLLKIDPVERNFYQHLEYAPLVNPRAHKVGQEHKILNQRFRANYEKYMQVLACQPALCEADKLAVAWAMTLQDRIEEAIQWFDRIERNKIAEQLQYDYLDAWLAFYRNDLNRAQRLAERYADIGVDLWRNRFELVSAQIKEIKGEAGLSAVDRRDRDQAQTALAATEPTLEMKVEGGVVLVKGANIKSCVLNFYPMDIELLFSRSPFVKADGSQFANIRPMLSMPSEIKGAQEWMEVRVPESLATRNVMVEAVAAGVRCYQVYYASTLDVQMVERYGQLVVRQAGAGLPVSAVYVKVYAKTHAGKVIFFKDGYTDLRGRFDYVSLNGNEIEGAEMLAILVLSDELGAVVREVSPPAHVR